MGHCGTLPWELRLYLLLATLSLISRRVTRNHNNLTKLSVVLLAMLSIISHVANHYIDFAPRDALRVSSMFLLGGALYTLRGHIVIGWSPFLCSLAAIGIAAFSSKEIFFLAYSTLLPYALICTAYLREGKPSVQ